MAEHCTNLQKTLEAGRFALTAEIGPPMNGNAAAITTKAAMLQAHVHAVNVTDNQAAVVRMSSIAAAKLALEAGCEPVLQMTCRDRNRIALQSDLLGAFALGLRNVLILSGDHQSFGNEHTAKNVYDVDSIQLLRAVQEMEKQGTFIGGGKLTAPVQFFVGATANPFADPLELQLMRLEKKIDAGARFIQTQAVYNVEAFSAWMREVRLRGLHKRAYILPGIVASKSLRALEATANAPGMDVPTNLLQRMEHAQDPAEEGVAITLELMERLCEIEGISGLHIMAIFWEAIVPRLLCESGLSSTLQTP